MDFGNAVQYKKVVLALQCTPTSLGRGTSENESIRLRASRPNHGWSYDFLFDISLFPYRRHTRT